MGFRPRSVRTLWLVLLLPPLLLLYAYGRVFGILTLESFSLYATLVLLGFYYWGPPTMRRLWFAVAYLGFLVRPPAGIVAELTQPLKMAISEASVWLLQLFDYPVASAGVRIQIGQYELLVQQACAGLGSIFSLAAICILYIHLVQRSDVGRNLVLLASIIPVALAANFVRVLLLILLTYHIGDDVAQGFAHEAAGIMTFAVSLLGMAAVDHLISRVPVRRRAHA
jgi:exosortase